MPPQVGIGGDQAAKEVHSLQESVAEFNKQASKQTGKIIKLTRVLIWLTAIMTALVGLQVYLTIFN